jgi:hypothetical protein
MFTRMKSSKGGTLFIELLMIVVGINTALWFEGLAEDFNDKDTEQQYLEGLRDDLQTDIVNLDQIIEQNRKKVALFESIIPELANLGGEPPDQQAQTIFAPSSYSFFHPADFTYTSMQESGDFRLLSDPDTKRSILRLVRRYQQIDQLQKNFIQALDSEYIPLMMKNFDLITMQITDPTLIDNQVFRNFFLFALEETDQRVEVLSVARKDAGDLLLDIEKQIHTQWE